MGESVEKGKLLTEIFFQKMLEEVLKSWKKMVSADLKTDVKQQKIQELVSVSYWYLLTKCLH